MRRTDEKIRVLMVLPKLYHGGAEKLVTYMLTEGFSDDFDVSLCTLVRSCDLNSERILRQHGIKLYSIGLRRSSHVRIIFRLFRIMRELKPHVVHTHLYSLIHCFFPVVLSRIPVRVHTIHNVAWHEGSWPLRMTTRFASRHFGFVLPGISASIAETIREYHGIDSVPVINNGIPVAEKEPIDVSVEREKTGLSINDFVCINVASFYAKKNQKDLISAFADSLRVQPNMVLLLVGDGPLRVGLEKLAIDYGIMNKVRFLGLRDDVMRLLAIADLFILPSHWEGLPISILEAMYSCLPVIATDVGGNSDIVQDGRTGLLVKPGDVNGLADAIIKMASDRELSRTMGAQGEKLVLKDFSISSTIRAHECLYKKLLMSTGKC